MGKKNKSSGGNNGFYYFMVYYKNKQGNSCRSLQEAAELAGPIWARMNAQQREPYDKQASNKNGIKYTSLNEPVHIIEKEENEQKEREIAMKVDIENIVATAINLGKLAETWFYVIHINDFCYCNKNQRNYPAEIAMLRFNLNEGVLPENVYHKIVKPGALPLGYASEAKKQSDESHQLEPPYSGCTDCNMEEVMRDIHEFLTFTTSSSDNNYPPIFINERDANLVNNVFDQLCDDYGYARGCYKIYSIQWLLYFLRNRETEVWQTISISILEFQKDCYDYITGIACDIHENSEVYQLCSRSIIIRLVSIICDNCCNEMGINMIAGCHLPIQLQKTLEKLQKPKINNTRGMSTSSMASTFTPYKAASTHNTSIATSVCDMTFVDETTDCDTASHVETEWSTATSKRKQIRNSPQISSESSQPVGTQSSSINRKPNTISIAEQLRRLNLPSSSASSMLGTSNTPMYINRGRGRGVSSQSRND